MKFWCKTHTRASTLIIVLLVSAIVYILGMSLIDFMISERYQIKREGKSIIAYYLASAGIHKAIYQLKKDFSESLVTSDSKINQEKLNLLDFDQASKYAKVIDGGEELIKGGKYHVTLEIINIKGTPFYCYLRKEDKVPPRLNIYKKTSDIFVENKPLAGWEANIRIKSKGEIDNVSKTIEVIKDIKVINLSPPAPEYTLFIYGTKEETLKYGTFILSNWDFKNTVGKVIQPLMEAMQEELSFDYNQDELRDILSKIKDFVQNTNNYAIMNKINRIIMTLSPWGKVRTNGRLNVFLPLFEVDDIINYFVDSRLLELPEIGYIGCNNRLHDRYMGKYTRYEGAIYKYYYELKPYIFEKQRRRKVHRIYTNFSTRKYYPKRHKDEFYPQYLHTILKNAKRYASLILPEKTRLIGRYDRPLRVEGIMYCEGSIIIGGPFVGNGIIVCPKGKIIIWDSLKATTPTSMLALVTNEFVTLQGMDKHIVLDCAVTAKDSIVYGKAVTVNGNLIVENLNRYGKPGEHKEYTSMPETVYINYDAKIRNAYADNAYLSISKRYITIRDLPGISTK